jgi:hypothetical protein
MNKLLYVAASNYRPVKAQYETSAVVTWNKAKRVWEEQTKGVSAAYKHIADFHDMLAGEMAMGTEIYRIPAKRM